ncbi:MAG: hypothetical protein KKG04_05310 [Candidatus Thermoplasmatota archaeon]|nr:hypothetical protein [Candidatus Thermoplasmatota archaeon]
MIIHLTKTVYTLLTLFFFFLCLDPYIPAIQTNITKTQLKQQLQTIDTTTDLSQLISQLRKKT